MFEKRFIDDVGNYCIYYMDQSPPKQVDSDKPLYLEWLEAGNSPAEVAYSAPIQYVATDEQKSADERAWRDQELRDSDWTQVPDASPPGGVDGWTLYRQELRVMPESAGFPRSHARPTEPAG